MVNKSDKIIQLYMRSKQLFNEFESIPRDFGTGDLLYSSEIHTLVAISVNEGINLTELANKLDISKSGTSKFVKKLLNKELIQKSKEQGNKKEVVFNLTDKGRVAAKGHAEFRHQTFGPIINLINDLSEADKKIVIDFLERLNIIVDELKKSG